MRHTMNVKSAPQSEDKLIRKLKEEEAMLLEKRKPSETELDSSLGKKQFEAEQGILEV